MYAAPCPCTSKQAGAGSFITRWVGIIGYPGKEEPKNELGKSMAEHSCRNTHRFTVAQCGWHIYLLRHNSSNIPEKTKVKNSCSYDPVPAVTYHAGFPQKKNVAPSCVPPYARHRIVKYCPRTSLHLIPLLLKNCHGLRAKEVLSLALPLSVPSLRFPFLSRGGKRPEPTPNRVKTLHLCHCPDEENMIQ